MSFTITSGLLSNLGSMKPLFVPSKEQNIQTVVQKVAQNYEIIEFHPEREEILLKSNSSEISSERIRSILLELQHQTQRSFVALINPASQYVLITVRG